MKGTKELSYQSTRRETRNNEEIIKESCCCDRHSKFNRILANEMIKEIKGKLAEELYTFEAGRATTDLIF
jgi:hypothetical protein